MTDSTHASDAAQQPLIGFDGQPAGWPTVSVIIPAYNSAAFVGRAIASAMAQSHRPLEIIVVDDGSTDATAEAVERYPVTLIRQANTGPGGARNTAAQVARGEWLAFLDHDDTWHQQKNEIQLGLAGPGIDAVFSAKDPNVTDVTFEKMYWRNLGGNPSSTLIRRETLIELGMFDSSREMMGVDDYDLWLRFLLAGKRFALSPELYSFTPAQDHYSGKSDKMLKAELVNIEKISALAGVARDTLERRKRKLILQYIPSLIYERRLGAARYYLRQLGVDRAVMRYWYAFMPRWLIDSKRILRRSLHRV